jgi:hypothetical protein
MSKTKEIVKSAIEAVQSGDAKAMKNAIREALLNKVKARLQEKETDLAKTYFSSIDTKKS